MRLTVDDGTIPDQARSEEDTRTKLKVLPEVKAPSRDATRTEPTLKSDGMDQIIMMVKGLPKRHASGRRSMMRKPRKALIRLKLLNA